MANQELAEVVQAFLAREVGFSVLRSALVKKDSVWQAKHFLFQRMEVVLEGTEIEVVIRPGAFRSVSAYLVIPGKARCDVYLTEDDALTLRSSIGYTWEVQEILRVLIVTPGVEKIFDFLDIQKYTEEYEDFHDHQGLRAQKRVRDSARPEPWGNQGVLLYWRSTLEETAPFERRFTKRLYMAEHWSSMTPSGFVCGLFVNGRRIRLPKPVLGECIKVSYQGTAFFICNSSSTRWLEIEELPRGWVTRTIREYGPHQPQ